MSTHRPQARPAPQAILDPTIALDDRAEALTSGPTDLCDGVGAQNARARARAVHGESAGPCATIMPVRRSGEMRTLRAPGRGLGRARVPSRGTQSLRRR